MSKVDDMLQKLIRYLTGADHSNTPQLRQAVQFYIQVCNEVNQQAAHCRQLLSAGLFSEAENFSHQMQPPLALRLQKLQLPPHLLQQLKLLSKLYDYGEIPAVDTAVLQELHHPDTAAKLKLLVMRWRKLARSGNTAEKLKLLHKIIASLPEPSPIWQNNLKAVEQQHINALSQAAKQAQAEHDLAQLTEIYLALSNPELTTSPPEELLQQLRPLAHQYQQQQFETELRQKRDAIYSAYSAMAPEQTAILLREYDILITSPFYVPDKTAEQTVDEVRKYTRLYQENRQLQADFKRKTTELINLLDQHADYEVIENTYAALQQMNLPLEQKLTQRFALRQAEYTAEQQQQHFRKCLYGILLCLVLLAAGWLLLKTIQTTQSYFHYQRAMQQMLQSGDFNGVIALHTELSQDSPWLLRFGALSEYKLQAAQKLQTRQTQIIQLTELCRQGEMELQKQAPNKATLTQLTAQMQTLQQQLQAYLPPELAQRYLSFTHLMRQKQQEQQQQLDRNFVRQMQQIKSDLDKYTRNLRQKNYDLSSLQTAFQTTLRQYKNLQLSHASTVSPAIYKHHQTLVQAKLKLLQLQIKTACQRQQTWQKLQAPASFQEYMSTLEKLPESFPDLARGEWQKALQQLPHTQILAEAAAVAAHYNTRSELNDLLNQATYNLQTSCFIRDIERLLPPRNYQSKFNALLKKLKNDLQPLYDCREICFANEQDQRWFFYTRTPAQIERRRSSLIPKAMKINVMLSPNGESRDLIIKIKEYHNKQIVFQPIKFTGQQLPPPWIKIENMPPTAALLPRSAHGKLLDETLQLLSNATSSEAMEQIILKTLQQLRNAEQMNIFARAQLVRTLIDFLLLHSTFYEPAVNHLSIALDAAALKLYSQWYQPDAEIAHAEAAAKLRNILQNMDPEAMQKNCRSNQKLHQLALSRGLHPAGIVLHQANKQLKLHWFNSAATSREIWYYTPRQQTNNAGWQVLELPPDKNDRLLLNAAWQIPHGGVFFTPLDGRNTAELTARIRQQFQANKNPDIVWPHSWPLNRR